MSYLSFRPQKAKHSRFPITRASTNKLVFIADEHSGKIDIATLCVTGASNATVRPYNRMAMSSIKALTGLRIPVAALFLIFGEYKVVGTRFTLGVAFSRHGVIS